MDKQKLKRLIAAGVSTAILLLFILLAVMIYQMCVIKTKENRIKELDAEIERLEAENEETEDAIDLWKKDYIIDEVIRERGWISSKDD